VETILAARPLPLRVDTDAAQRTNDEKQGVEYHTKQSLLTAHSIGALLSNISHTYAPCKLVLEVLGNGKT
jgi:hypothetical protein